MRALAHIAFRAPFAHPPLSAAITHLAAVKSVPACPRHLARGEQNMAHLRQRQRARGVRRAACGGNAVCARSDLA